MYSVIFISSHLTEAPPDATQTSFSIMIIWSKERNDKDSRHSNSRFFSNGFWDSQSKCINYGHIYYMVQLKIYESLILICWLIKKKTVLKHPCTETVIDNTALTMGNLVELGRNTMHCSYLFCFLMALPLHFE